MKLAITTLNFNGAERTIKLLDSLKAQSEHDFDLVITDNASEEHDFEILKKWTAGRARTHLIRNPKNTGFSGGANTSIKKALELGADWVVVLNNDTWVEPDFVKELKPVLESSKGIVGLAIDENSGGIARGGNLSWLKATLSHNHGHIKSEPKSEGRVRYAIGGGMAVARKVFEEIGFFDENYFLYFEDADFSLRASRAGLKIDFPEKPIVYHAVSASTGLLGQATLLRYHYRNALYFNWKNGSWPIKIGAALWSLEILIKQLVKVLLSKDTEISSAIAKGVFDMYLGKMGKLPDLKLIRVGIECESIEGKNPMWGIGRIIVKLLEELASRPELEKQYKFVLYFKDKIPDDMPFLNAPIFEKKITPVPGVPNRLFPIYYYALLPLKLFFEELDLMFWPNYMLPIIAFGKSLVLLTEDVYYESHDGKLPFRYRLAYGIFGEWSANFATRLLAISENSKKQLAKLYEIDERRIVVDHLGIDFQKSEARNPKHEKDSDYILYVGQAFPRRHLKETILAFEKIAPDFEGLKLIAVGPDKYEKPTIASMVKEINKNLGREAVIHKDYVSNEELTELYAGAKALVYVSEREAFGLPPMEALTHGVPPVIMDNELGRELFGPHAIYAKSGSVEDIAEAIKTALEDKEKMKEIKSGAKDFLKKYTWKNFADRWLAVTHEMTNK